MRLLTGLLGGVLAGVVGAAAWAAVVYFTHYELGIVAWAIGALVGVGVLVGSGREGGPTFGALAAAIAIAAVLAGKWAFIGLITSGTFDNEAVIAHIADVIIEERSEAGQRVEHLHTFKPDRPLHEEYAREIWSEAERRWNEHSPEEKERLRRVPAMANPVIHLVHLADGVCAEREAEGAAIDWPEGFDVTNAWREAHYPPDVWAEAVRRWEAWSPQDRQTYLMWIEQEESRRNREFMEAVRPEVFRDSFDLFDALWLLLAVVSAFSIAARSEE